MLIHHLLRYLVRTHCVHSMKLRSSSMDLHVSWLSLDKLCSSCMDHFHVSHLTLVYFHLTSMDQVLHLTLVYFHLTSMDHVSHLTLVYFHLPSMDHVSHLTLVYFHLTSMELLNSMFICGVRGWCLVCHWCLMMYCGVRSWCLVC